MVPPKEEITVTVVQAVSEALETPIEELPPLADTIDPDALDVIVSNDPPSDVTVTFSYAGRQVLVREGTIVSVRPGRGEPETHSGMTNFR